MRNYQETKWYDLVINKTDFWIMVRVYQTSFTYISLHYQDPNKIPSDILELDSPPLSDSPYNVSLPPSDEISFSPCINSQLSQRIPNEPPEYDISLDKPATSNVNNDKKRGLDAKKFRLTVKSSGQHSDLIFLLLAILFCIRWGHVIVPAASISMATYMAFEIMTKKI